MDTIWQQIGLKEMAFDISIPKKELGQHWLSDETVLKSIATTANIMPGDTVIEIGPGLGTLTKELLSTGAMVTAVEFDSALAASLATNLGNPAGLTVIEQDIRKFRFDKLPKNYKIVANIPYYLTSNLLRILTDIPNKPITASLLVQKEVAERVASKPGHMSRLSVITQTFYNCSLGIVVPAKLFSPPPKVDSQVLVLEKLEAPLISENLIVDYLLVVKAGFSERRKQLRSSLGGGLKIEKTQVDELLKQANITPQARAQELSIKNWQALATQYKKYKNSIY
ncbi:MAG: 16S rRNA (adenine(1518)-N(6)/adenine(1519)-N(6))-dimethyltransferase RsmA [Patescibacteria group bacterium]|jgi:16S rRNA (adenine1518-N6/adenine1519-N6)-dimethyltransferase|nr:16S rRNA (adenine(1518)-N(6)/adenine(1519)-N(6))-dimethyltransferase RsmA [Patescibacteria group bacterium]